MTAPLSQERLEEIKRTPKMHHWDGTPVEPWQSHRQDCPGCVIEELLAEVERQREALTEYADHQSWRCQYRTRYGECCCGLDNLMASLGLPPIPVSDPEAVKS